MSFAKRLTKRLPKLAILQNSVGQTPALGARLFFLVISIFQQSLTKMGIWLLLLKMAQIPPMGAIETNPHRMFSMFSATSRWTENWRNVPVDSGIVKLDSAIIFC